MRLRRTQTHKNGESPATLLPNPLCGGPSPCGDAQIRCDLQATQGSVYANKGHAWARCAYSPHERSPDESVSAASSVVASEG